MPTELFELIASLGLPSAVVAMVVIAALFKNTYAKVAFSAAVAAVLLVLVLGIAQLVEVISGRDLVVRVSPSNAFALTPSGSAPVKVAVSRGDELILEEVGLQQASSDAVENRLRNLGYRPATECPISSAVSPQFWSTNRVHVGQRARVGDTAYGVLHLRAVRFTAAGTAIVALELAGRQRPIPGEISIKNKALEVQAFPDIPEFYVAVREADFTGDQPWAAFGVFTIR